MCDRDQESRTTPHDATRRIPYKDPAAVLHLTTAPDTRYSSLSPHAGMVPVRWPPLLPEAVAWDAI